MPITPEQREQRRKHIGSSDAAAICGRDPYKSAIDVYNEKVHQTEDFSNPQIEVGNILEPVLIEWVGLEMFRQDTIYNPGINHYHAHDNGIMAANLDAWIDEDHHIEAKTTGMTEGWGDPNVPNEVPEKVLIQCHHQFACAGTKLAYVPVLIGDFGLKFRLYRVERVELLITQIELRCVTFWTDYVERQIAPPDSLPSLEVLKRIIRVPNKIVTQADSDYNLDDLSIDYEGAKAKRKDAEELEKGCKALLIGAMDDAEALETSFCRYTYFEQTINYKAREAKTGTSRTLRKPKAFIKEIT